ncbi:MAG: substrate-binding domain-containing protein [Lentisphaeria bacterium]|nr:substrate-binding domain-containing protein [Lentisphaeria bacterium]
MLLPLSPGDKLPGIRTLMKRTGYGQITVTNALRELQKEGFVRVDPYRGIFRIRPTENERDIRLIHWQTLVDSKRKNGFFQILFRKLQECAKESGRRIVIENVKDRLPEDIASELVNDGISRCIVCSARERDFAVCLKRRKIVCLELLPRHTKEVTATLRDAPDMTVRQMDYLLKRGYRRIGYLTFGGNDTTQYPLQVLRLMDYYRLMAENGLKVDPDWVLQCSDRYENLNDGMDRIMNTDPCPEVLIVPGAALSRLYPWCRRHRIRIGKDLAVFSCDDYNEHYTPEPTSITNNPEHIAETFWEMFQAAERGEKVESRYTELFIRTGMTVPHLKNAGK